MENAGKTFGAVGGGSGLAPNPPSRSTPRYPGTERWAKSRKPCVGIIGKALSTNSEGSTGQGRGARVVAGWAD